MFRCYLTFALLFVALSFSASAADGTGKARRSLSTRLAATDRAADRHHATLRVDRYATATRLTAELTRHLQLTDEAAQHALATCIEHILGVDTPAGFLNATSSLQSLDELLRQHTATLQRVAAPVLPQPAYDRYVALLDELSIKAE